MTERSDAQQVSAKATQLARRYHAFIARSSDELLSSDHVGRLAREAGISIEVLLADVKAVVETGDLEDSDVRFRVHMILTIAKVRVEAVERAELDDVVACALARFPRQPA